jgi:hypothetical protein
MMSFGDVVDKLMKLHGENVGCGCEDCQKKLRKVVESALMIGYASGVKDAVQMKKDGLL